MCWALFTRHHWAELSADPGLLGSSYWLGALGWALLLGVMPGVFLVEQCLVPDPLPELRKAAERWWRVRVPLPCGSRSFSEGPGAAPAESAFLRGETRYKSFP